MSSSPKIVECMKKNVVSISANARIGDAAALFVENCIGTLPVVDETGRLVGLLIMRDLLALVLPDFIRLVEDFDFVGDFGAVEARRPDQTMLAMQVVKVMHPPVSVDENCGLLRAYSAFNAENLADLPVVDTAGHLIGIASRVDIGVLLLSTWTITPEQLP
jgi:CBS domain-containing protein